MKSPEIRIAEFILKDIDSKRLFVDKQLNSICNKLNKEKLYLFFLNKTSQYTMDFFVQINENDCDFYDKKPEGASYHVIDIVANGKYHQTRIDYFTE